MMQPAAATPIKTRTTLVDITKCIGCRACQVACKQWNDRDGETTRLEPDLGFRNPAVLSAKTYTLISFHEIPDPKTPGGLQYASTMWRCLHCLLRDVARRGALAPQLLPDVWRAARDGAVDRQGSREAAIPLVRLLQDALAVPTDLLPVLRQPGRTPAVGRGH
jgi:ferredoxin